MNKQLKTVTIALYKPGDNMFVLHSAKSIWKQFKSKIGQDCMAMNSVIASNPQKSGENQEAYWERMLSEFENREGVKFKFLKIYKYLKEKPRWKVYCNEVSSQDMKRKSAAQGHQVGKSDWSPTRPMLLI
jgi:hypothetical protein